MFAITLTVEDREAVDELCNCGGLMDKVRNNMANNTGLDAWMSEDTKTFLIDQINLERYLEIIHGVYISKA